MKPKLGWLYDGLGALGAIFILLTLLIQVYNIVGRIFGFQLAGADSYVGYTLAAGSFLALATALRHGDHIRVTLILGRLGPVWRVRMEIFCLAVAVFLSGFFAYYSIRLSYESYIYHDISTGLDATPLWIPQIAMALGTIGLFFAFIEELIYVVKYKELVPSNTEEMAHTE
jgi:TRAP-type C4-dicarboxylate transport system permease small subunit